MRAYDLRRHHLEIYAYKHAATWRLTQAAPPNGSQAQSDAVARWRRGIVIGISHLQHSRDDEVALPVNRHSVGDEEGIVAVVLRYHGRVVAAGWCR